MSDRFLHVRAGIVLSQYTTSKWHLPMMYIMKIA